jgi:hypothetical protein
MDQPAGNPLPRKSGGGALKWILLGCGGIILLIVAFVAVSSYLVYRSFNTDPVKVEETAQEIVKFDKPAGFKGMFSVSMMGVKFAVFGPANAQDASGAAIVLGNFPSGKQNQEQFQRQLKESMEKKGHSQEVSEQRPAETFKVRGNDVPAQVAVMSQKNNADAKILQYILALDNTGGNTTLIMVMGPEKTTDHAWVQKFLDTVK